MYKNLAGQEGGARCLYMVARLIQNGLERWKEGGTGLELIPSELLPGRYENNSINNHIDNDNNIDNRRCCGSSMSRLIKLTRLGQQI